MAKTSAMLVDALVAAAVDKAQISTNSRNHDAF
jgi:hypothetical protein